MMKKMKFLALCLCLVMAFPLCAGCGGDDFLGGEEVDVGDLVVWTADPLVGDYRARLSVDPTDKKALMTKEIIDGFKEKTGVKAVLKSKGWGVDLNRELQNAIGAGTMPDITVGEQFLRSYVDNGHFEELNLSATMKADLLPELTGLATKNNKLYAAPIWTGSFALLINLKALRDCDILNVDNTVNSAWQSSHVGINPLKPATWEDLLEICKYMKTTMAEKGKPNGGGILLSNTKEGSAWRALTYMRTAGGDIVGKDGKVAMDSPANKKAFNMMRELVKTSPANSITAQSENTQWDTYLFKDLAGYIVEGNDVLSKAETKKRSDDFIAVELPTYEIDGIKANVVVGSGYYSISKTSDKKETALQFIEYLLSDEVQMKFMEVDMRLSSRQSVLDSAAVKELPKYDSIKTFLAPFVDETYSFEGGLPNFENNPSEIWESWNTFSSGLLKADKDGNYKDMDTIIRKAQADMYNKQQGI